MVNKAYKQGIPRRKGGVFQRDKIKRRERSFYFLIGEKTWMLQTATSA